MSFFKSSTDLIYLIYLAFISFLIVGEMWRSLNGGAFLNKPNVEQDYINVPGRSLLEHNWSEEVLGLQLHHITGTYFPVILKLVCGFDKFWSHAEGQKKPHLLRRPESLRISPPGYGAPVFLIVSTGLAGSCFIYLLTV